MLTVATTLLNYYAVVSFDQHFSLPPSFPLLTSCRGSEERCRRSEALVGSISGGCFGRPALCILGQATKRGHICCVLVWKRSVCVHNLLLTYTTSQCRLSPSDFVNDEVLRTVEGFRENVKANLWHGVTICEISNDASLSVCACSVRAIHCLCVDILLAQL